ncbi:hypothetical protein KC976_03190 [Candidatus Saccharibacteria bacterium]|nr:hypothetical protein [Candidatus Saccharibacteria bacterium]
MGFESGRFNSEPLGSGAASGEQVISAYADPCDRNCFKLGVRQYGISENTDDLKAACNTVPGCILTYSAQTIIMLAEERGGSLTEQETK